MAFRQESRQVEGVRGVILEGVGEVLVKQGDQEALTVSADESLIADVKTNVDHDGILHLSIAPLSFILAFGARKDVKFDITVKNLDLLQLSGAGQMQAALKQNELRVVLSGAGTMELNGTLNALTLTLSGAGSFKGDDLACQNADVTVSGAGSAFVTVLEQLKATVSGVGSVHYSGSPRISSRVTGLGSIVQVAK